MKMKYNLLFVLLFGSNVFAQSHYPGLTHPTQKTFEKDVPSLNSLLSSGISANPDIKKSEVSDMRRSAIEEIATSLGASGGLSNRMRERRAELEVNAAQLDQIFDFSKMIIDNGVLAPILTEGLSNYSQESNDQVRIADKIYKIEGRARFVSVYPTWRNYLLFSFPTYDLPAKAYLPQNDAEKIIWDSAVKKGWEKGKRQADDIIETSYARLDRDYKGMIKYKILLAEGLITPTIIAKQNLGVTGGGDEMSINDQIFRITDHSTLNPNQQQWKVEYPITNNVNGVLK